MTDATSEPDGPRDPDAEIASGLVATTVLEGGSAAADAPRLTRGTNVGRYVVIDCIGSGGMGVVYSAYDPELDRRVALKLLRADARGGPGLRARDRLLREAQAMAKLSHANVLPVFDVGTHESAVFIALEFVEGETLRAWLERERPHWSRALPLLVAAGRGLAAAHAEGLAHRDFKPENVMIGRRGEVRVMDFGLARAFGDTHSGSTTQGSIGAVLDDAALTRTGFVLGTPAYMAPEQHRGLTLDARADQFAYCVTLYEALYGHRPFEGRNAAELVAAATAARFRPIPRGLDVPTWLRRIVVRGLQAEASARWSDMDQLLAALQHDRTRTRRAVTTVVAVGGTAAALGLGLAGRGAAPDPCAAAATALDEVWTQPRRDRIAAAFGAAGVGFAGDTWTRVDAGLDAWAGAWVRGRVDACEDVHVRHEQTDAALDVRNLCLDRRRVELDALLGVFEAADAAVVERAVTAAAGLGAPQDCDDVERLLAPLSTPAPGQAARVAELGAELLRADALRRAARYEPALAQVEAVAREAQELGFAPLLAQAEVARAQLEIDLGRLEPGTTRLAEAVDAAEAAGLDELVARGDIVLATAVGVQLGRSAQGERWARAALAKATRLGGGSVLMADALLVRATVADAAGDFKTAREHTLAAIDLWDRLQLHGPQRTLAISNLGRVAFREQDWDTALREFERAHAAAIETFGPQHPDVAKLLSNIASVRHAAGDFSGAQRDLERALAIFEAALPPDHPSINVTLANVAALAYRQGRYPEAISAAERAIASYRRTLGPDTIRVAPSLINEALALAAMRRDDEALARYREAAALFDTHYPDGHPEASKALTGVGEILSRKGEFDAAAVALERAVALGGVEGMNPYEHAEAEFALARVLWDADARRDRTRAHGLAVRAAQTLRAGPPNEQRLLATLETWLQDHPEPR
ncbi:MAG: serine/threonine-protein kinase [Nannocystaceae bacterium]|nr:serine/threonine-protein kinase [Nannocystaceae bacterium]